MIPAVITRLEKAALDNGFDRELPRQNDWLAFASSQVPMALWLAAPDVHRFVAAVSQQNVARGLSDHGVPAADSLPPGAVAGRSVSDIASLHRLIRRAFQLSKALPDELLHAFQKATVAMPRATEAERLVVTRVGQEIFRGGLIEYWEGRCAVTGLAVTELLRASHVKPWAACESDAERLDVFNGLLLAPNLDAAFDRGYVTVADDGEVLVSSELREVERQALGLHERLRVRALAPGHQQYLRYHRETIFRRARTRFDDAMESHE